MNKLKLLAAAAMAMAGMGPAQAMPRAFKAPRVRVHTGNRYPEQSSRQAMRGARRAQGGPGIELVEGQYIRRV